MTPFAALAFVVAIFTGAVASVAGFGIGSILTPFLGIDIGVKLAVAAVTIPHVIGNALRFWTVRHRLDRDVLKTFGLMSALGSFAGAMLHVYATAPALRIAVAVILILAGLGGVTGVTDRLRFGRRGAWAAGGVSGMLGGLIGNQGGIRAAAMLALEVPKEAFIATATATALIVDAVRIPIYIAHEGRAVVAVWPLIAIVTVGVIIGTLLGRRILGRIPEQRFRRVVAALILTLGVSLLFRYS